MTVFSLSSVVVSLLLAICTSTYLRPRLPDYINPKGVGFNGMFGRFAVVGERLSPAVCVMCVAMAFVTLLYR